MDGLNSVCQDEFEISKLVNGNFRVPIICGYNTGEHSKLFNDRFLRERGMASTPKMEYQVFLWIFQKNSDTLGLKEMEKFLWECRKKGLPCWLSQFSKIKLR